MKFNKKMIIMLCSVVAIILLIIVIMMLVLGTGSKILSYAEIENRIVSAGKNYYEDNQDKLPVTGSTSIDTGTLIAEGYLNDLSRYTEDGVSCSGKLYVTKNPNDYSYRANLDCGNSYETKTFKDVVMQNLTTSGSGLYESVQVAPGNSDEMQTVYIFKGDNVNNYIKVGDYFWRIVKIFENGEIMVVGDPELLRTRWDNRFNLEENAYRGINEYEVSRMKDSILSEVVEDKDGYLLIKSLITPHTACIGRRYLDDTSRDGSVECSETLTNQYFSLIAAYDYMNASMDTNCKTALDNSCYNYNYLASSNEETWTITGVADNTYEVYYIDGTLEADYANVTNGVRLLAHLDANVTYVSGTGTYEDPYILK